MSSTSIGLDRRFRDPPAQWVAVARGGDESDEGSPFSRFVVAGFVAGLLGRDETNPVVVSRSQVMASTHFVLGMRLTQHGEPKEVSR